MLRRAGVAVAASALFALSPVTAADVLSAHLSVGVVAFDGVQFPLRWPRIEASPAGAAAAPWVAVGDFDGDGRDDIVRLGSADGAAIWFGRSDHGTDRVSIDPGAADAVTALDVDADGTDELLLWSLSGSADASLWRHNSGGGSRSWRTERVTAPPPASVAYVAELTGDGRDDVLWHGPTGVDALDRALSSGGFSRETFAAFATLAPKLGDFDGDEVDDVLWYDPAGGAGAMWWGGPTISAAPFNIGTGMVLHVGQWDGDGATDLLVGGDNGNVELDGHEDRHFTADVVPPAVVAQAVVADVNGDRRSDLIELTDQLGVWNNDGSGWLWEPWNAPPVPVGTLADGSSSVVAADLDGDGTDETFALPASSGFGGSPADSMWLAGYRREAIYEEANPYADHGLTIRMLGITGGRRIDPTLRLVHDACGAEWPVHEVIADRLQAMLSDAAAVNLAICINSSYRPYSEQVAIRQRMCGAYGFSGNQACIYDWRSGHWPFVGGNQVARPGYSRHQVGIAVDVGDIDGYATYPVTSWLSANAHRYGLYNLGDRQRLGPGFVWGSGGEPWHLSIDAR